MNKKLCCPKCKSKDLQYMVTNETNVTSKGGGYSGGKGCLGYLLMGPLGLLCGACGSKQKITTETKHNAFWVCLGCGNKFKGVNEINEELEKNNQDINAVTAVTIIMCILGGLISFLGIAIEETACLIIGICLIVFMLATLLPIKAKMKKDVEKLEDELKYIKENAFEE